MFQFSCSYGIPETVELVHHGESFYIIGEIKITGRAMKYPACSLVTKYGYLFLEKLLLSLGTDLELPAAHPRPIQL